MNTVKERFNRQAMELEEKLSKTRSEEEISFHLNLHFSFRTSQR